MLSLLLAPYTPETPMLKPLAITGSLVLSFAAFSTQVQAADQRLECEAQSGSIDMEARARTRETRVRFAVDLEAAGKTNPPLRAGQTLTVVVKKTKVGTFELQKSGKEVFGEFRFRGDTTTSNFPKIRPNTKVEVLAGKRSVLGCRLKSDD